MPIRQITACEETRRLIHRNAALLGRDCFTRTGFEDRVRKTLHYRPAPERMPPLPENVSGTFETLYGCRCLVLSPESPEAVLVYLHGGAYLFSMTMGQAALCAELAGKLSLKVILPLEISSLYETCERTLTRLCGLWAGLSKEQTPHLMGDSSGGGLALALCGELMRLGLSLPRSLGLISPLLDVTLQNPEIPLWEDRDLSLSPYGVRECGLLWAGRLDPSDPRVSPVALPDVAHLPPLMMTFGSEELLWPDGMKLYDRMRAAGAEPLALLGEGMFHAFPVFPQLPEAAKAAEEIRSFLRTYL